MPSSNNMNFPYQCFLFHETAASEVFTREDLTKQQRMIGEVTLEFMRREVLPRADEIYGKKWQVTRDLLRQAGELDLLRIDIPEKFGGLGLDKVSSAFVGEHISMMPSFGASLGAHTAIGTFPILFFGTDEQREKYLPKIASGEWVSAYCLTEPDSGSDALAAKTKAILSEDGKHYILNGRKMWITNGGIADVFTIFAKVDGDKFTAFIVEKDFGIECGHEEKKLGLEGSSTTALILNDIKVPVENVLGGIGKGHLVAFNILNLGRLKLGTRNLGSAKIALNGAIEYARSRHQFGKPISSFGMIEKKIAEMAMKIFVGDAMVWRTLGMVDNSLNEVNSEDSMELLKVIEQYAVECSIIKVWTSEAQGFVIDEALQIHGGYGYSAEYPIERAYRDARITRIYEGTNEINRTIIAARLLKYVNKSEISLQQVAEKYLSENYSEIASDDLQAISERFKAMTIILLSVADSKLGSRIREEQQVAAALSEIIMESFAVESAMLRISKNKSANKYESDNEMSLAVLYTASALSNVEANLDSLSAYLEIDATLHSKLKTLLNFGLVDRIRLSTKIAQHIVSAGKYLW
jgi:alkylation response protein AidB-like acyl-CoA dehydrogenase